MRKIIAWLYQKFKVARNENIVLSNQEFDRFTDSISNGEEPSDKIRKAANKLDTEGFDTSNEN